MTHEVGSEETSKVNAGICSKVIIDSWDVATNLETLSTVAGMFPWGDETDSIPTKIAVC